MKRALLMAVLLVGCTTAKVATVTQHRPVVPRDERARMQKAIEASGPTDAPWTQEASRVLERWKAQSPRESAGVRFSEARCFVDGCIVTATYSTSAAFSIVSQSIANSDLFLDWPGARYRSPIETLPSGQLVADWIFFRPESRTER